MRNHFINYTTVGVFVAAMIVALLWALAQISGRTGPTDSYGIVMDSRHRHRLRHAGALRGLQDRPGRSASQPEWDNGKYQFQA